jgi:O-methyltransferase
MDAGDPHWTFAELAVSLDEVRANFARYGLLDEQVRFLPGWFRDTLPGAPIERISVLRLDGDMYESTWVALEALYPKLARGGYVVVDDYLNIAACRAAVDDFRRANTIADAIHEID